MAVASDILHDVVIILKDSKGWKKFVEQAVIEAKSSNSYPLIQEFSRLFKFR